jgi:hypothetical protein
MRTITRIADNDPKLSPAHTKAGRLQRACLTALRQHETDGALPTSVRFVFYELVQAGIVDKGRATHRPGIGQGAGRRVDQDVSEALMHLRERRIVPWGWLVDETRTLVEWRAAPTVVEAVRAEIEAARIDPWGGNAPLILTESRSLSGVLREIAYMYAVPIASTNGQVGGFLRTEIAPLLDGGRRPVLYLGDLDHAGRQIEQNNRRVLVHADGWRRIAITPEQVAEHGLPAIVRHDRRYNDGHAHEAWETEALSQRVIVGLVRDALDALLPEPLADIQEREQLQRDELRRYMGSP